MSSGGVVASVLTAMLVCSCSFAQTVPQTPQAPVTRQYRPAWGAYPQVKRPTFDYSEVHNSKLIAEAGDSLDFLAVDNLVVGSVTGSSASGAGFLVIPRRSQGRAFYVDRIQNPRCAVIAQSVETPATPNTPTTPNNIVSNVYIGQIDFRNCN